MAILIKSNQNRREAIQAAECRNPTDCESVGLQETANTSLTVKKYHNFQHLSNINDCRYTLPAYYCHVKRGRNA